MSLREEARGHNMFGWIVLNRISRFLGRFDVESRQDR